MQIYSILLLHKNVGKILNALLLFYTESMWCERFVAQTNENQEISARNGNM